MAYIKKGYWAARAYSASGLKTFIDAIPSNFFETSIENSNDLYISLHGGDSKIIIGLNSQFTYVQNRDEEAVGLSYINGWNPAVLVVAASDTMFYLQWWNDYGNGRRMCALGEMIDGNFYFGATGAGTGSAQTHVWYNINDFSLVNRSDTTEVITHGNRLNYARESGNLEYTGECVFASGVKTHDDPNFKACSTVNAGKIITIGNDDYFSVGPHTLLKRDPIPTI